VSAESKALSCDEVDDLAAAWALDAITPDERAAIDLHLLSCTRGHPLISECSEAAALLALSLDETAPPPALGHRIMDVAGRPAEASGQAPLAFPVASTRPERGLLRTSAGWWAVTAGVAAVLAVAAIGLGAWGVQQHAQLVAQRTATRSEAAPMSAALQALAAGGSVVRTEAPAPYAPLVLIQPKDGSAAYVLVSWSPAPAGKSYQAWFLRSGQAPQSAAVFSGASSGIEVVRLDGPILGVQSLAVTLEPAGGSSRPTSQPFLVSGLPA